MNTSLIFSLRHVGASIVEESLDLLMQSPFKYFEVSGSFFESEFFGLFKKRCFDSGKKVASVFELMPASLSRNWANSSEKISSDLQALLSDRLSSLFDESVPFAEIDLALDEVAKGQEVVDIERRSQLLSAVLAEVSSGSTALLLPLRFPKATPKSFEWRYTTMLQNEVAHPKVVSVANIFPYECNAEQFNGFFKKTFYTTEVIRFCFDPVTDGFLNRDSLKRWLQVFCDQGFEGKVILSPKIESLAVLKESLSQLSPLQKPYEF